MLSFKRDNYFQLQVLKNFESLNSDTDFDVFLKDPEYRLGRTTESINNSYDISTIFMQLIDPENYSQVVKFHQIAAIDQL